MKEARDLGIATRGPRNEALDTAVYALAAATVSRINRRARFYTHPLKGATP